MAGLAGLALAGGLCCRRLEAEYHWARANTLEQQCNYGAAREVLDEAVALFPEFGRLERTWLLAGKLDHHAGRATPEESFFRAYQLARSKERLRTAAHGEDLPWVITGSADRPGGLPTSRGPASRTYNRARDGELRLALAVMDDLLAGGGADNPAVLHQAARLQTDRGLACYRHAPAVTDAGLDYSDSDRQVTAARGAWLRAARLVPAKSDCVFYLARTRARVDAGRPGRVEAEAAPLLSRLADRTLRSEVLNDLGDAYLRAGQANRARFYYAESCETFSLPEIVNYRALKGLGGL